MTDHTTDHTTDVAPATPAPVLVTDITGGALHPPTPWSPETPAALTSEGSPFYDPGLPAAPTLHMPPAIKRLHSVVCFTFHRERRETVCYSIFVAAGNVQEAIGDRMHKLLAVHPIEDGWDSHSVDAIAVPDKIVCAAAMALYEAEEAAMASPLVPGTSQTTIQVPVRTPVIPGGVPVPPGGGADFTLAPNLPPLNIGDFPRFTVGPQMSIGSSSEGKILPVPPMAAAAMAAARNEVSEALRGSTGP